MISHGPEKRQLTGLTEVLAPFRRLWVLPSPSLADRIPA